jgi:surface antigen
VRATRFFSRHLVLGLMLPAIAGLAACSAPTPPAAMTKTPLQQASFQLPAGYALQPAVWPVKKTVSHVPDESGLRRRTGLQCVEYARSVSGIEITGNARNWWAAAAGTYQRSKTPAPGSVLVFRGTRQLPYGHVAVVRRLIGPREITIDHSNWVRGRITHDVHVVDVSSANDWSQVRVWWGPAGQMGIRAFPTYGFIYPNRETLLVASNDTLPGRAGQGFRIRE